MAEINTSIQLDVKSVIVIVFVVVKNIYFGFKKEKKKDFSTYVLQDFN